MSGIRQIFLDGRDLVTPRLRDVHLRSANATDQGSHDCDVSKNRAVAFNSKHRTLKSPLKKYKQTYQILLTTSKIPIQ